MPVREAAVFDLDAIPTLRKPGFEHALIDHTASMRDCTLPCWAPSRIWSFPCVSPPCAQCAKSYNLARRATRCGRCNVFYGGRSPRATSSWPNSRGSCLPSVRADPSGLATIPAGDAGEPESAIAENNVCCQECGAAIRSSGKGLRKKGDGRSRPEKRAANRAAPGLRPRCGAGGRAARARPSTTSAAPAPAAAARR